MEHDQNIHKNDHENAGVTEPVKQRPALAGADGSQLSVSLVQGVTSSSRNTEQATFKAPLTP